MSPDELTSLLAAEFADDVTFGDSIPATITAPGVYVAPAGDPWLLPGTHGTVEENWDVVCASSIKEPKPGIDQLRQLNLRVRRAISGNGAVWRQSDGPRRSATEQNQIVISANQVSFRYLDPPREETP